MKTDEHGMPVQHIMDLLARPRRVQLWVLDDDGEPLAALGEATVERGDSLTFHFGEDAGRLTASVT